MVEPEPEPAPDPEPAFEIRAESKVDIEEIGLLVGPAIHASALGRRFDELRRAGGGVVVEERGRVVAGLAWDAILTLHEAPIGRVTLLVARVGCGDAISSSAPRLDDRHARRA